MRTTRLNATLLNNIQQDVVDAALPMLKRHAYFIFEDAIRRANKRGHRDDIDWSKVKALLEKILGQDLVGVGARAFLNRADGYYEKTIRVRNQETRTFLERLNGNKTAGYCFPWWDREFTQRRIIAQEHAGDGLHSAARALAAKLDPPTLLGDSSDDDT